MHNLIGITDDVKNLKLSLSDLSAFWGESYMSIFKKLVKSSKKPLTQIINRLSELEAMKTNEIRRKSYLDNCVFKNDSTYNDKGIEYIFVSSINVNNFLLKCVHSDNVVQLTNEKIIKIDAILMKKKDAEERCKLQDLYLLGYELTDSQETFIYPISSKQVGVFAGNKFAESKNMFPLKDILCKYILLHVNNLQYVISLLHT